jgi:hypothetical protein
MPALHSCRISAVRCCVCCAVALTCGLLLSSTCSIAPRWDEPEHSIRAHVEVHVKERKERKAMRSGPMECQQC